MRIKTMRNWIDLSYRRCGGRYFETAENYKKDMLNREDSRNIRSSHINRKISKNEQKTILPFVEDCLFYKKGAYANCKETLYPVYRAYCTDHDMVPLQPSVFGTAIKCYVFLAQSIKGVLMSRKTYNSIGEEAKYVAYYNLGVKEYFTNEQLQ